jgi:hypothetical protein
MNMIQFDPRNPNIGQRIRAWWFNGQTNSELDLMGSPGQWDLAVGGPRGVMAGGCAADRTAPPYMMSSPGQWDLAVGGPRGVMAGGRAADRTAPPYRMSSPGTWSLSDGGPQDMMAGRQR